VARERERPCLRLGREELEGQLSTLLKRPGVGVAARQLDDAVARGGGLAQARDLEEGVAGELAGGAAVQAQQALGVLDLREGGLGGVCGWVGRS
jgi:hypothetical protein